MPESACWYSVEVAASLTGFTVEEIVAGCAQGNVRGPIISGPYRGEVVAAKWRAAEPGRAAHWVVPVEWIGAKNGERKRA